MGMLWQSKLEGKAVDLGSHRFAAYAASKAALNQALRVSISDRLSSVAADQPVAHGCRATAGEQADERPSHAPWRGRNVSVLETRRSDRLTHGSDMADISLDWVVEGIISPKESVSGMITVIESKTIRDSGTFWTWDGKVPNQSWTVRGSHSH